MSLYSIWGTLKVAKVFLCNEKKFDENVHHKPEPGFSDFCVATCVHVSDNLLFFFGNQTDQVGKHSILFLYGDFLYSTLIHCEMCFF